MFPRSLFPVVLCFVLVPSLFAEVRRGFTEASLTGDLAEREKLAPSPVPLSQWYAERYRGSWGPRAMTYPPVEPPRGVDAVAWKRARVVAVAKHYIGLPYQHHHIPQWTPPVAWTSKLGGPESAGLDCSNFTGWVYNFGLGIRFTSDVNDQADGPNAPGRKLEPGEKYEPGDLLFILQRDRARVSHVVIYVDEKHVIDSHGAGVAVRPFAGWYRTHLSHARRVIE